MAARKGPPWPCWALLLVSMALLAGLHLACWPLVWRLVILPRASPERHGLEAVTNDREDGSGRDIRSRLAGQAALELERSHAMQLAYGLWRVERAGLYQLRLECDDYGSVSVDRRRLIDLHGTSDFNQGQAQVHLEAGLHLFKMELHNRQGRGWMRLLVKGPGQDEFALLEASALRAIDLANHRAWLSLAARLERAAVWGLGLCLVAALMLWAHGPSPLAPSAAPPAGVPEAQARRLQREMAGFVAAVVLLAALSSWHTAKNHVEWVNTASGHDYLTKEEYPWHRAITEGRHHDHRAYRVLPHYLLALMEMLPRGYDSDPTPAELVFWARYFIDLAMFLMAALFYRRLGLSRGAVFLGMALLAFAMWPTAYRTALNFATFLDVSLFLLAGVLVLEGRLASLAVLSVLAALTKETSILIPLLPLAAALGWRPLVLPRRELLATLGCLALWLLVYGGMHLILGWGVFDKPHDQPGLAFVKHNLLKDPDSYRQLMKTLGVLPLLSLLGLPRAPQLLRRFFWTVAPVWFAVHTFIAWWAETRLYMVPMALLFIPLVLLAAGGSQDGRQAASPA